MMTSLFKYDRILPMNTGAEGVETALKLARKWAYKKKNIPANQAKIVSFENNFHGRTFGAISLSTDPESREGFGPFLPGLGVQDHCVVPYNDVAALEDLLKRDAAVIAAVLIEPIQGEAGIVVPDKGYIAKVFDLCVTYNVLMIADEIQSGLGRSGKMLAVHHDNIQPHMIILGKALSGGVYPVSAVLASNDVMECIEPGQHGSTYGGNPLACAVAMEAMAVIQEENLCQRSENMGQLFRSLVNDLNHPAIQCVRGKGLMNAVVIHQGPDTPLKGKTAWDVCLLMKRFGLLAKPTHGNIIRMTPALCIEEQDIRRAVDILKRALDEIPNWDLQANPLEI